ncbi:MAG: hypothetical protein HC927_04100 [Deltaproteobacteria bacterium]|nr:hypothetical protein [Deltaproteobacteria bacterium]
MNAHRKYSVPNELSFELSDFLNNAWRQRYAILTLVLVFTGAVTAGALRLPKEYKATACLLIDPVLPRVLNENTAVEHIAEQARQEKAFYTTQQRIISSRSILQDTIARLDLQDHAKFKDMTSLPDDPTPKAIEGRLASMLDVALDSGSRIVNVTVQGHDPEVSAAIANTVGQAYIDYTLERGSRRREEPRNGSTNK